MHPHSVQFGCYVTSFYAELCLPDGKNAAFFTVALAAVSDWLNPHSLGTMSAVGYIENVA